jgi:cardiolipin synthase
MPTHRPTTFSLSLIGAVAAVAAAFTFALPLSSAVAAQIDRGHTASTTTTTKAKPGTDAVGDSLLTEPQQGYQPVDALILGAEKSVDMTMYELADPVVESDLASDAHRGVTVRVVLDQEYSGKAVNLSAYAYLAAHRVHVVWSYPSEIFHQKTITVDGRTSLIMTGNLTSKYYATTRDFGVFDTNAADVSAIEAAFASDFASHRPAPAGPGTDLVWSPGSKAPLVALINSAQHTLTVENEEMDSTTVEAALAAAAQRGVRVDVTMTYSSEWTAALARLIVARVHVRLYHGETPIYVHAKVISVDAGQPDQRAFIGSENFSTSSLVYNRELGLVTIDPAILNPLNATLASDFAGTATR